MLGPQPNPSEQRAPTASSSIETFPEISSMTHGHQVLQGPWRPRELNRHHSWSQQDRKHDLQSRLLEVKKGDESGFTEIERGGRGLEE